MGLPEKKKIYLFISTNGEKDNRKGYQFINNYFKNKKENNNLLIKIGNHKEKNFDFEINLNTFFHGNHKKLKIYYSACDILLSPSTLEAFGQVAIEAASCGTPSVAFKNTGVEDAINHKITGYLASYMNQKDFEQGIEWIFNQLLIDKTFFNKKCVEFVSENFSSRIIAKKYINIYKSILEN